MFSKIITVFFTWRILLFIVAFLATIYLPTFGNRFPYSDQVLKVTKSPSWVWGFGNFDGVHYLRIAQDGYSSQYSQAFFPLYPLVIRSLADLNLIVEKNPTLDTRIFVDPSYFFIGFILSNTLFLLALMLFYKLVRLDFKKDIAFKSVVLLAFFPTSFFFGSIYTESLFLFLALGAFYFMRKNNFLVASVFIMLASATKVLGLLLIPALIVEIYLKIKKKEIRLNSEDFTKAIIGTLLAPFGSLLYMLYLRFDFNNPLYFLTSQPAFGAERTSGSLILLPQVFFRYIKIFFTVPKTSSLFFNAFLEFSFTVAALICIFLFIKKMRISYLVFTLGCLIIPTLTGTLSSMPRYVLMGFLLLPLISQATRKYNKLLLAFFMAVEAILLSLFIRGYWIA